MLRRRGLLRCVDFRLVGPVQPARRRQLHPRKTVLLPEERRLSALPVPELHQLVQATAPATTSPSATTARSRSAARAATPATTPLPVHIATKLSCRTKACGVVKPSITATGDGAREKPRGKLSSPRRVKFDT